MGKTSFEKYYETLKLMKEFVSTEERERFDEFMDKVEALYRVTQIAFTRGQDNKYPKVTQESLDEFKKLQKSVMDAGANFVFSKNITQSEYARINLVKRISEFVSMDYYKLINSPLQPEEHSIADMLSGSRGMVIDVGKQPLGSRGGQMSSRIPLSVTYKNGTQVKGFLTKSVKYDLEFEKDKCFGRLCKTYPELTNELNIIRSAITYKNVHRVWNPFMDIDDPTQIDIDIDRYVYQRLNLDEAIQNKLDNHPDFHKIIYEITSFTSGFSDLREYYNDAPRAWVRSGEGSSIDTRNASMTAVADLLGMPNIIPRSTPMTIMANGEEITGTFMEYAPGIDMYSLKPEDPEYNYGPEVYDNPAAFKQLADLQVLDWVCGNVDRHEGNMFMSFDKTDPMHPKFTGVCGIDNDMSFTLETDNSNNVGTTWVQPEDMMVISSSAANAVLAMTKESLSLALVNQNLSQREIDAAWTRTQRLQQFITEGLDYFKDKDLGTVERGKIRVVNDDEWGSLSLEKLTSGIEYKNEQERRADQHKRNQFEVVSTMKDKLERERLSKERANQRKQAFENNFPELVPKEDKKKIGPADAVECQPVQENYTNLKGRKALFDSLYQELNNADSWYIKSSDEFKKMKAALENVRETFSNMPDQLSEDYHEIMNKDLNNLLEASLNYEMMKTGEGKGSDYAQKRLDVARKLIDKTSETLDVAAWFEENSQMPVNSKSEKKKTVSAKTLISQLSDAVNSGKLTADGYKKAAAMLYVFNKIPAENGQYDRNMFFANVNAVQHVKQVEQFCSNEKTLRDSLKGLSLSNANKVSANIAKQIDKMPLAKAKVNEDKPVVLGK